MEKMLATTDANKFSPYLQSGAAELGAKRGGRRDKLGLMGRKVMVRLNSNTACDQMLTEEGRRRREEPRRR